MSSAWLADYEINACRRVADELAGSELESEEFLRLVTAEAEGRVNLTQPDDDPSHFTVADLDEEDRKELLERGGYDVDNPEVLAVVTAMPRHTIVSDGTAKHIAQETLDAVSGPTSDFSDLQLFAATGAVSAGLRDLVVEMKSQVDAEMKSEARDGRRRDDLERLEHYLDSETPHGPLATWSELTIPGWADRSALASPAYLAADSDTPALEH